MKTNSVNRNDTRSNVRPKEVGLTTNNLAGIKSLLHRDGKATEPGPSKKKLSKAEARDRYNKYSGNHPTIHCNRFPGWDEMSKKEPRKWRDPEYKG